jgi:UDP-N-acetylmuramoyl-L-alanyl-D-glutamate--2,6-diaminopimelate ligase
MSNHAQTSNGPRTVEIGLLDFFGREEADLSQPRYDSRDVKTGDVFFAIRGYETDGHKFISPAIERGASTIVLDDASAFSPEEAERRGVNRMLVKNSRRALAFISEAVFGNPSTKLRMIGVTGTNGKTTVTNIIKQLLEAREEKTGLIGTIGITIGDRTLEASHTTPESRDISEYLAQMVREGVTTCVMEVSSHALALDRVAALDFDIAAFTNLTQDHLDFHKTMDAYFAAKQMLFQNLKDTAVAVTNADEPRGLEMVANTIANSHTYGIRRSASDIPADLFASEIMLSVDGTTFWIQKRYSEERALVRTHLVGAFNVENALAALSALYFGVEGYSLEVLASLMQDVRPVRGRFETIAVKNGATAIIDYAHTPDALERVLSTIRNLHRTSNSAGKIMTVFGCGGDRDRSKRPAMGAIAARLSDYAIITSDNPRSEAPEAIATEIWNGIPFSERPKIVTELDRAAAIARALGMASVGDAVLIAGKGHENYQIFGTQKYHFDDREQVEIFNENY